MKAGDKALQSELVANWADKRLAFIGDGDAISVCVPTFCFGCNSGRILAKMLTDFFYPAIDLTMK